MVSPTIPGSDGAISNNLEDVKKLAHNIGYPILLKAAAGGGGRGMRIVHEEKDLNLTINQTKQEAKNAFGDDTVEEFLSHPRHIEIQVLSDGQDHTDTFR